VITAAYQLRERGEAFYIGPTCPPDIQRKAGVPLPAAAAPPPPPEADGRQTHVPPAPSRNAPAQPPPRRPPPPLPARARTGTPAARPVEPEPEARTSDPDGGFRLQTAPTATPTPVIVDDAMNRMAGADELNEADFGSVARDLSVMAELPSDEQKPEPTASMRPPPAPGKQKILVVDDEPEIRKLVRRVLEDRGFYVYEAARGHQALALLKELPPDLIVLDAMLPEVHGFDIAKRMKGTERYGHIPIVMISAVYRGWRFAEDLKQSYGVDAYLEKPFKMADLVRAVETALTQKGGPASNAEHISAEAEKKLALGIEAYQKGDLNAAIEHLKEGTRLDPLAFRLHFHLGLLHGKQGRIYDAIQELQTALDINGRHFPALKNLAVLYQKVGFRNKAIETWERALRVAPDDATRQSIKEHLVGLL
jgi:DNA-binding response OmpR family regulator